MKKLESKRGIYCSKCGTKLEDGWACGRNGSIIFGYCPTCDEFVQWQQMLGTGEVSEQGKESMKSFLRSLRCSGGRRKTERYNQKVWK
jgi:hypothetical protein